jgi:hypothetical protein
MCLSSGVACGLKCFRSNVMAELERRKGVSAAKKPPAETT